jgi:uncharacterized membrane protein
MLRLELVHPMIVHFPIVLVVSFFVLDAYSTLRGRSIAANSPVGIASIVLVIAAGLSAVAAYAFGDEAYEIAEAVGRVPANILETHQDLGTFTALAIAGWAVIRTFLWWRAISFGRGLHFAIVAIEGLLVAAVVATAWYGGQLVYDYGVAVSATAGG